MNEEKKELIMDKTSKNENTLKFTIGIPETIKEGFSLL